MNFCTWLHSCYLSYTHCLFDSCYPLLCCESLEAYQHRQSLHLEDELIPIRQDHLHYEAITSEDTTTLQYPDDAVDNITQEHSWYLLFQNPLTCLSRYSALLSPLQQGPPVLTVGERLGRGEGVKGVKGVAFDPEVRVLTWSMKARVLNRLERSGLDSKDGRVHSKDVDGCSESDTGTSLDTSLGTSLGTSLSTSLDTPLDTD